MRSKAFQRSAFVFPIALAVALGVNGQAMADTVDTQSFHFGPSWATADGPIVSWEYNQAILGTNSLGEVVVSPAYVVPNLYEYVCVGDGNPPGSGPTGLQETTFTYNFELYGSYKTSSVTPTSGMVVVVDDLTKNFSEVVGTYGNNEYAQLNAVTPEQINLSRYSGDAIKIEFEMNDALSLSDWYVVSNPVVATTLVADSNSCSKYA